MKIVAYVGGIASLVLVALACGGASGGYDGAANLAACEKYAEHMQNLECLGEMQRAAYTAEKLCMSSNTGFVNLVPMYECYVENAKCGDDGIIDLAGMGNCSPDM